MLNSLKNKARAILKSEEGQGMVEYALIIGFVAVFLIIILTALGPAIAAKFQEIITAL